MTKARFITLEGGEGAGKSTQVQRLAAWLSDRGIEVLATREPGGSPGAEEIRNLLVHGAVSRWDATGEALLHYAARRDHLRQAIWPALASGRWVVCDRFADSTFAYQGYGHGLALEDLRALHHFTVGDFGPDLTLLLDLPVEIGLERAAGRKGGGARYETMDLEFHQRLRRGFLALAAEEPTRFRLIDATQPPDAVAAEVHRTVEERFGIAAA